MNKNMSNLDQFLFKHFLNYDIWREAKKLLDFQIASKFKYYNTLNFYYFRKVFSKSKKTETQNYFKERILNNAFYGLEKEFSFFKYTTPKQGMGLRAYLFFSYPMQLLYYSIGLYLLKVTSQFISDNKKGYNLSRYGGDLKFHTSSGELIVDNNTTLYNSHYSAFKKDIRKTAKIRDNQVVIRLDIQNYFDCISMSNMLELIDEKVKPSEKTILVYDDNTKRLLNFFFLFLNNNALPQASNNIISGYLGFLYLFFGDLEIESLLGELNAEYKKILKDFKIIRYVDDIYIFLEFNGLAKIEKGISTDSDNLFLKLIEIGFTPDEILEDFLLRDRAKHFITDFLYRLSDIFYKKLGSIMISSCY